MQNRKKSVSLPLVAMLVFCSVFLKAQSISDFELKEISDNLAYKSSVPKVEKIYASIKLAHTLVNPNPDSAQVVYLQAITNSQKNKLIELHQRILIDYAWHRLRNNDVEEAERCLNEALKIKTSNQVFLSDFYFKRISCGINKVKGNFKEALFLGLDAKQHLQDKLESESNLVKRAFYQLALVNIQSDIANLYKDTKQLEKSISIQKENLQQIKSWDTEYLKMIEKEEKDKFLYLASAYNNLGLTYISRLNDGANPDTLIEGYFKNAVSISQQLNNQDILLKSYYNFSKYAALIGSYTVQYEFLLKALQLSQSMNNSRGIIMCKSELADNLLIRKKNPVLALQYAMDAIKQMRAIGESNPGAKAQVLATYLATLKENNYTDSVLIYSDSLNELREAELKQTYDNEMTEMQTKYETAEKEKEILKQQTELSKNQIQKKILFGGLAALLLIIGLVYRSLLQKKKASAIIEHQKEIVETKNKEILQSIRYSKRLQEAILPPAKLIREKLNKSFVLYKPKDIIAGDFYWLETNREWTLFAAADCTGHGVPGALVSVVCSNALNRAIKEFNLTDPGKILDKVRELVIETFEKSESEVKDGMDISLCVLDQQSNILKWAGANNPLWIIRKGANSIEEVKPDHQPIGTYSVQTPFTTHQIYLKNGDSLYIFTDGFVDQFGGEQGKKFKSSQLKQLLLSVQSKDMDVQQGIIDTAFEKWKRKEEQLDDVCIIGVRV